MSKKPSLAEVAEVAGVSISTVSKVANRSADVSDATRDRIERILKERGYVATRKRRGSLTPVTLLARSMHTPYVLDVLRGALDAADRARLDIGIARYPETSDDMRWIDEIAAAGKRGVIAITSTLNESERERFARLGLPIVVIDPLSKPTEDTYSIGSTNWAGGLAATEHLLELGHRRIAMLSGYERAQASQARRSGYLAALSAAGDSAEATVIGGDFTYESGLEVAVELLTGTNRPSAVFAANDFQALGVLEAARRAGLRVPEDLSVVGFDDLVIAQTSSPPLTTVRQPLTHMGSAAVETLSALICGATDRPHHTELATRLVVRGSTAPPAAVS